MHDPDFKVFAFLNGTSGIFLDVGANTGQSARSLFEVNSTLEVYSFEANPHLESSLLKVKSEFPERFKYLMRAVLEKSDSIDLYIPQWDQPALSVFATLNPSELKKAYVGRAIKRASDKKRLFDPNDIKRITVPAITIDSLELDPVVIKIDVEGSEARVIQGARRTIERGFPFMLIENNNYDSYAEYLKALDYVPYRYDLKRLNLNRVDVPRKRFWNNQWSLNHFWICRRNPVDLVALVNMRADSP